MTELELLRALRGRDRQISELKEKCRIRRDAVTRITPAYGEKSGDGGNANDRMANYAGQIDALNAEIGRLKRLWQAEMEYCVGLCDRAFGVERALIYSYYGKSWSISAIARANGYSDGYLRKAKSELDRRLDETEVHRSKLPRWYWEEADC